VNVAALERELMEAREGGKTGTSGPGLHEFTFERRDVHQSK